MIEIGAILVAVIALVVGVINLCNAKASRRRAAAALRAQYDAAAACGDTRLQSRLEVVAGGFFALPGHDERRQQPNERHEWQVRCK